MKKALRIVACLLVAVLACFSFSGCEMLDEMRACHAKRLESGNIELNGQEYRALPSNQWFQPDYDGEWIYVTDPDVPVLLSTKLGDMAESSSDGLFIRTSDENSEGTVYCRLDRYDEMLKRMEKGFTATGYCYSYLYYDEELEEEEWRYYFLTKEEVDAVDYVRKNVPGKLIQNADVFFDQVYVLLERYDQDQLFRQYAYDVYVVGRTYYLMDDQILYTVPTELNDTFASLMKKEVEMSEKWEEWNASDGWSW